MSGDDDMNEPSSPVCAANEADAAYMGYASREEIVAFLGVLLEAERAGARVTLGTTLEARDAEARALAMSIHRDEVRWCGVLFAAIKRLDGEPSLGTGAFYEKAMAIADLSSRFAFLNRGQEWVARKLREMLPKIRDEKLHRDLKNMLSSHERNIEKVASSGLAQSP